MTDEEKKPRVYVTKKGVTLQLNTVSNYAIRHIREDKIGMPQPPIVETTLGPKKIKHREANPEDPEYKAALNAWNLKQNDKIALYVVTRGVASEPSEEEARELREFTSDVTGAHIKYLWVLEQLIDDDEFAILIPVIMGQTIPTEQGIGAAESRFPGDSERDADRELSSSEVEPDAVLQS